MVLIIICRNMIPSGPDPTRYFDSSQSERTPRIHNAIHGSVQSVEDSAITMAILISIAMGLYRNGFVPICICIDMGWYRNWLVTIWACLHAERRLRRSFPTAECFGRHSETSRSVSRNVGEVKLPLRVRAVHIAINLCNVMHCSVT